MVVGTVFFDGNVVLDSNATAVYAGRGVVYASGRVQITNWTALCGAPNCDPAAWNPNDNLLVFVAGSSTDANGFYMTNNARLQGGVYALTDVRVENSAVLQGPVVSRQLYISNFASTVGWQPIGALLVGMPSGSGSTTVSVEPGSWAG